MAGNPILTYLPLNGTLAGTDRNGTFSATGSGALRWQPADGARVNYVLNPRCANDTANWTGSTSTISRVADAEFVGGYALNVKVEVAGIGRGARTNGFEQGWRFGQGQRTFSFDAKAISAATTLDVYAVEYDAAGTLLASGAVGLGKAVTSSVQRFSQSYTPTNAATEIVHFGLRTKNSVTVEFRISNVVVEEGNIASPAYFDGSSAGASWFDPRTGQLGTAHASPSCEQLTAWVEEGTTNYIANPRAESNTTGWFTYGDRTLSRDTTKAYIGSASFKVEASTTIASMNYFMSATGITIGATGSVTASAMVYVPTSWTGGDICIDARGFGLGSPSQANVDMSKKGQWQRVSTTFTASSTSGEVHLTSVSSMPSGQPVNFTNIQLENKSYATSYCDGSLGTGYSWAGTAHASASTRTVTSVYRTKADVIASGFSSISGSWIARVLVPSDEDKFTTIISESDGYGSSDWLGLSYTAGEVLRQRSKVQANAEVSVSSLGTVVYGSAYIAYGGWSDSVFVAVDSEPAVSALRVDTATNDVGIITFGGAGTEVLDGYLGPVAIYDRPLTDAELAKLDAAIDTWTPLWRLLGSNRYNQFQLRPIGA